MLSISLEAMTFQPILYVVATPIGNLGDFTIRAQKILQDVDLIACEDTRITQKLCQHYDIYTPLLALHQHNEQASSEKIIRKMSEGSCVALVSDAGTPGISDPGDILITKARKKGFVISPIPGASALTALLSIAGQKTKACTFTGFFPEKASEQDMLLENQLHSTSALVFYESPHRVLSTLMRIHTHLDPDQTVIIGREITKRFENISQIKVSEIPEWIENHTTKIKGEFAIYIGAKQVSQSDFSDESLPKNALKALKILKTYLPPKQAAKACGDIFDIKSSFLYNKLIKKED